MKSRFGFLPYALLIVLLIAGCASPQTAAQPPAETEPPTKASPGETSIVIDGDPSDWEGYPVLLEDPIGDGTGQVDVKSIRAFTNDRFVYLLVEVAGEIGSYFQLDVDFNRGEDGWPDYMANAYPNNEDFVPHVARIENRQFNHFQNTTGEVAQGAAFELRIPLDLFTGPAITTIGIRVMDGECCESKWIAVDHTEPVQIPLVDEIDVSQPAAAGDQPPATEPAASGPVNLTTSGKILVDETWSGEITLTGDIWVSNGATLTIDPGTIVFLTPGSDDQGCCDGYVDGDWDSRNAITIDAAGGFLIAEGTEEQPIVFTVVGDTALPGFHLVSFQLQASAKAGAWDGLHIGRGSSVQYTDIRHANRAIEVIGDEQKEFPDKPGRRGNGCNIPEDRIHSKVSHNRIRNVRGSGISVSAKAAALRIDHNTIENAGDAAISVGNRQSACIHHNVAKNSGVGVRASGAKSVAIFNNLIIDAARGVEIGETNDLEITNNTIALVQGSSSPDPEKGINVFSLEDTFIVNNIIAGQLDWAIGLHEYPLNSMQVSYNLYWQVGTPYAGKSQNIAKTPVPGMNAGNLEADPMLADVAGGDFHLLEGSPAIDAGAPDLLDPDGSPSDLGAYGGPGGNDW